MIGLIGWEEQRAISGLEVFEKYGLKLLGEVLDLVFFLIEFL